MPGPFTGAGNTAGGRSSALGGSVLVTIRFEVPDAAALLEDRLTGDSAIHRTWHPLVGVFR